MYLRPNWAHGGASPIRGSCPGTCGKRVSGRGSGQARTILYRRSRSGGRAEAQRRAQPQELLDPVRQPLLPIPVFQLRPESPRFVSPLARNAADRDSRCDRARVLGGWRTASFAAARGNGRVARSDANVARPGGPAERPKGRNASRRLSGVPGGGEGGVCRVQGPRAFASGSESSVRA